LGNGRARGCPLVVHCLADLQSVHEFRCYNNSAESEMSASACTRSMPGFTVITPHRSTTHVDTAYCYRPSRVVCRSVCLSLCLHVYRSLVRSVTVVSPAKTAKPIKVPFGLRIRLGPRNHLLDGVNIPSWEWASLRGEGGPL